MAASVKSVSLTVLARNYCHLCADMITGLQRMQAAFPFTLEVVDVDADAELERRYGEKVPVLLHGHKEICHFHLDDARLADYLSKIC